MKIKKCLSFFYPDSGNIPFILLSIIRKVLNCSLIAIVIIKIETKEWLDR